MCTTIISHFILYAPYGLKKDMYHGTFPAIIIALLVSSANAYMTIYVYNTYKNNNLLDINKILLGKFLGGLLSIFNIAGNLVIGFFMYRGLLEIIKRFMLPATSMWALAVTLVFIFYIGTLNSNKSFLAALGFISLFVMFWSVIYILLGTKPFHMYYAKAALIHSFQIPNLMKIGTACFYFTGVSHLSLFNPEFSKISTKNTILVYIFVGTTTAILAIYFPAGMLGPYLMQKVQLTVISAADTIGVDLFVIERGTYILLPMVFLLGASDMIIWAFVGWGLIRTAIPNRKINLPIFLVISILYIVSAALMKNSAQLLEIGSIAITGVLFYHYLLFIILFVFTKLKKDKNL